VSKLSLGLVVAASFLCGAAAMSFYQSFSATTTPDIEPAAPSVAGYEPHETSSVSIKKPETMSAQNEPLNKVPIESATATELVQQIEELQQQVANQQTIIASYKAAVVSPQQINSRTEALHSLLEEQARDEAWAYQTETAMADFLIMADLPVQPDMTVANCKTSVCEFKLQQPEGVDSLPAHYWRNISDKLMEQGWWKQFKYSSSTSSDDTLSIIVSTEQ